jgi:hypothetical protein
MTLYAASLMDIAKPVESKKKGKKIKEEVTTEEPTEAPVKHVSEKRMAALAKAQETRKRKREEAATQKKAEEEAIASKEAEIQAKQEEIHRKKEELKEKRRLKREAKQQEATPPVSESSSISEGAEPKQKKVRKPKVPRDDSVPPTWFQKYVEGVKHEEAKQSQMKVTKKQVEEEARQTATQQWQDGFTRDRVQNEVDGHMTRMYGMIFHNRKMK